jgi:hypothetical protein
MGTERASCDSGPAVSAERYAEPANRVQSNLRRSKRRMHPMADRRICVCTPVLAGVRQAGGERALGVDQSIPRLCSMLRALADIRFCLNQGSGSRSRC